MNDISEGRRIALERGANYVFDKGYCDYGWWWKIEQAGAYFVTRLKRNASFERLESRAVDGDIVADEVIRLNNTNPGGGRKRNPYERVLRRVVVAREPGKNDLVLVSNLLDAPATEIAALYKRRWAIELFFKWIKQNLKIRQFLGRSDNAVRTQLLVALITYLLAHRYRRLHGSKQTFYLWLSELKATLFQRPDLVEAVRKRRRKRDVDFSERQPALAL